MCAPLRISDLTTVTFKDGPTLLGTGMVAAGAATLGYTFTTVGTPNLTASYSGDANSTGGISAAVAQNIYMASTTTLSANPSPSRLNQAVTLTATVTGVTPTGTVTFLDGATPPGTGTIASGIATLSTPFATAGAHSLTASYAGDASNPASTSAAVAQTVMATALVSYIQADHLDTPRTITDTSGNVVWQWDNIDPFGNNVPNENPSNQGQFSFNLRFPGQYFDRETNLAYNVNRDYDASIGRYIESDPIGLLGGFNTYTYVLGNPLRWTDPMGLETPTVTLGINPFYLPRQLSPPSPWIPPDPNRTEQYICQSKKNGYHMVRDDKPYDLSWRDAEHYSFSYQFVKNTYGLALPTMFWASVGYSPAKMALDSLGLLPSDTSPGSFSEAQIGIEGASDAMDSLVGVNQGNSRHGCSCQN